MRLLRYVLSVFVVFDCLAWSGMSAAEPLYSRPMITNSADRGSGYNYTPTAPRKESDAVRSAREALEQAQASGDQEKIQAAEQDLAEIQKKEADALYWALYRRRHRRRPAVTVNSTN